MKGREEERRRRESEREPGRSGGSSRRDERARDETGIRVEVYANSHMLTHTLTLTQTYTHKHRHSCQEKRSARETQAHRSRDQLLPSA